MIFKKNKMEGTISLYHDNISTKLNLLKKLIDILFEKYDMTNYYNTVNEINNEYKSQCAFIFVNENNDGTRNEYTKILESINIISNIRNLYDDIKHFLVQYTEKRLEINNICRNFENTVIKLNPIKKNISICDICESETYIVYDKSILKCSNDECCKITPIITSNFDANSNEIKPSKNKTKRHKSDEHCELWIKRIQAIESEKIPQHVIDKLVELARKEYTVNGVLKKMDNMKCSLIRRWLREIKETKYYNNSPSIRKIVTGFFGKTIIPPQLSEAEKYTLIEDFEDYIKKFEIVVQNEELLEEIGKQKIKYKLYYPDILYRLINKSLRCDWRKKRILECIKLQNEKTLIKNDKIWKMICNLPSEDGIDE